MYTHNTEELSRSIFFFFCTTLIYIKRYKIAITIITVAHRYHWRYHNSLATTLLHDLHLWHREYQDSTTIHNFTHTHTHSNIVPRGFLKVTRNGACCLQLLKLRLPRMPVCLWLGLKISVSICFLRDDFLSPFSTRFRSSPLQVCFITLVTLWSYLSFQLYICEVIKRWLRKIRKGVFYKRDNFKRIRRE